MPRYYVHCFTSKHLSNRKKGDTGSPALQTLARHFRRAGGHPETLRVFGSSGKRPPFAIFRIMGLPPSHYYQKGGHFYIVLPGKPERRGCCSWISSRICIALSHGFTLGRESTLLRIIIVSYCINIRLWVWKTPSGTLLTLNVVSCGIQRM